MWGLTVRFGGTAGTKRTGEERLPLRRRRPHPQQCSTGLFRFSDILDTGSGIFGVVSGCVAEVAAVAETGVIAYGGVVGAGVCSAVGAGAAVVGSCALGGTAGYHGAEIVTYG